MRLSPVVVSLLAVTPLLAAPSHIGIAVARGEFFVDRAAVRGNSTIFEGSVVSTPEVDSDIQLASGARIRLAAGSEGRVYSDRLVLRKGASEVTGSSYRVEALGLRILPGSATRVSLVAPARIQVTALVRQVRVNTATGFEVASVLPGAPLEFSPQSGAAGPIAIAGKLKKKDGVFYLTDCFSKSDYQVVGENLDAQVDKNIQIKGTVDTEATPAQGFSRLLRAANIESAAPGLCAAAYPPHGHGWLIAGVVAGSAAATGTAIAVTRGNGKGNGKGLSR